MPSPRAGGLATSLGISETFPELPFLTRGAQQAELLLASGHRNLEPQSQRRPEQSFSTSPETGFSHRVAHSLLRTLLKYFVCGEHAVSACC